MKAEEHWRRSVASSMDRDRFSALLFADKKTIAQKHCQDFGVSARRIKIDFKKIEHRLRNPIAHGSDYALTVEAARETVAAARLVRDWIRIVRERALRP